MTGVPLKIIKDVQRAVQRSMRYVPDQAQYGVADKWVTNPPSNAGDCEDFVMTKRDRLVSLGYSGLDCRLVLCHDWRGTRHAVLFVRDDKGLWWILDNQAGAIYSPRTARRQGMVFDTGLIYGAPDQ